MKEKILFVYDSMMTGGTTTALLSLLNTIDRSKYEISLLLYTNTGAHLEEIPEFVNLLEPAYKESKYLNSRSRKIIQTALNGSVFLAIKSWLKYRNTAKGNFRHIMMHYGMAAQVSLSRSVAEQYDYALGFMEGWANEYVASSKINAKRKFAWIHPQYKSCYLIPEIDKKIFRNIDGIALVSEYCLDQFLEYFPEYAGKTKIVPNIVSPQVVLQKAQKEEVAVKQARINFCTVCRCDIQVKGLDRLLKIFYELKEQGLAKDILWHFIGGGAEFEQFKCEVEKLGMEDTIILYGNKLNPLAYLCKMNLFVLASRYEGKPMAVTEAQALGLPCMVTNYEAAPSQVQHRINGIIMENNYDSIYEAIKMVIQNPSLLSEWKANTISKSYGNENEIQMFYDLLSVPSSQTKAT